MRKSYRRNALILATNTALMTSFWPHHAQATTYTWISSTSQTWTVPANWSGGTVVPGQNDTALFTTTNVPPSHSVTIPSDVSIGAIVENLASSGSLTIDGSSANVTLYGQSVNVPYYGTASYSGPNVIISATSSTNSTSGKFLNLGAGLTLKLANPTNIILGAAGDSTTPGSSINIASNISDGTNGAAGLTYYGNGNFAAGGGSLNLSGNNSFSGGLTIGSADGLNGGQVGVISNSNLGTGSIVVNDQGQLSFNASGTYGNSGQLLTLNGTGQLNNSVSSGAIRTGAASIVWDGDVVIGASLPADGTNGQVVVSATNNKTIEIHGQLMGSGNLQKQGGGVLLLTNSNNTATGTVQIGNGALTVASGSSMPTGDLVMLQSSKNTGVALNLDNALQQVGNLSNAFTQNAGTTSTFTEYVNLGTLNIPGSGGQLNIHQTINKTFGYGVVSNLQATIQGPGSISLDSTSTAALTLNGPNLYDGGTTINGGTLDVANGSLGSATGPATFNNAAAGTVTINSGGNLASGQATVFSSPVTSGTIAGPVVANSGGNLFPGGGGTVGSLTVGGLVAHSGSNLNFDLAGGATATFDQVIDTGSLSLDDLASVKIFGSKLATGDYQLISFNGGSLSGSGGSINPATNPGGNGRIYTLTLDSGGLSLDIQDNAAERYWSTDSGASISDGPGTWTNSVTKFYDKNPNGSAAYDNASSADVIIGNNGTGGLITLGSNIRVGGALELAPTSNSDGYTVGTTVSAYSLQIAGGIVAANSATINAPVILEGSQTLSVGGGTNSGQYALTINGNISEISGPATLTKEDVGTLILNGTGSYTGGTVVDNGVLQTTTSAVPATGGITNNANANLIFSQANSGTYSGDISGGGIVTIANSTPTATTTLAGVNSYTGPTMLQSGALAISTPGGIGAGTIFMDGGTLLASADVSLPSTNKSVSLVGGTTSTFDTSGGHTLTLNNILSGGGNLTKTGDGTLVIAGIHTTDVIGNIAIAQGAISLAPSSGVSYGFGADPDGNTFQGDLVVTNPLEIRLQNGLISGGGAIRVKPSGVAINSKGQMTIANNIILNDNTNPISGFSTDFGANTNNLLAITGVISGQSDVDFTNGAGSIQLGGSNTYLGSTTIDTGTGGSVQLLVDNALPVTTAVHITSSGLLDLNGHNQTIASLDSGAATAELINNAQTSDSPSVLTINGSADTHYDGFILDGNFSSVGLVLASTNTGSLGLNGTFNTYTGGTTINGGTLSVFSDVNIGDPNGSITFGGGNLAVTQGFNTSRPITVNPGGGTIDVADGTILTVGGSGTTNWAGGTLTVTDSGTLAIARGGATIAVTPGSTLAVGSLSTVTVDGSQQDPFTDSANSSNHVAIVNNGSFSVTTGNVVIASHTGTGTLSITGGADVQIAPIGSGNSTATLSIDTDSGSKLDLSNNAMAIASTPIATIRSELISGRASGAWNGQGINSSSAAAVAADNSNLHKTALGYAQASQINAGSMFFNQPIDSTSVLIRYTYVGDANLDGTVNALDFNALATNYGKGGMDWAQGDFNYSADGTVDSNDFDLLAANFGQTMPAGASIPMAMFAAQPLGSLPLGTMVPEPVAILPAIGLFSLIRRRRRE